MSDIRALANYPPVFLLPNEIKTDKLYNVRPFSSAATAQEDKRIVEMAASIEAVGQLDALIITPDHVLVAGHRRRKAAIVINERRTARGESLLRLRCAIDDTGQDLRRKSLISNLHRKDGSPMDMAYMLTTLRAEYNWGTGWGAIKKAAEYLGIDTSTVLSYERLLSAEKELQNQVHDGILSIQSALTLMRAVPNPKERAQTVERASEIQMEDRVDKALDDYQAGKINRGRAAAAISQNPARVAHPSVIKAIRERATATSPKKFALSRRELIASINQFDVEGVPEMFRLFAHYWVTEYALGKGTAEDLRAMVLQSRRPVSSQCAVEAESAAS